MSGRILTAPNLLTVLRGVAALPVALAIASGRFKLALVLVVAAGLTDGLDGILARRTGQISDIGRLLDPIADKVLLVTIFVTASLPGRGFEPLPWWLAAMAIGRDVGIVGAAGVIYALTGFSGFTPTWLGKLNTLFEIALVAIFLGTRAFGLHEALLTTCIYLTATSIVASGLHYIVHVRRLLAGSEGSVGARAT